ncbi:hypothetical protein E4U15_000401 [Claviceps sp. LM218 group G6]|nr:hypothetical protein E4U15_000401 [Claviceps sp. LM218 group G6]
MLSRWSLAAARDIGGGSRKGKLNATRTASRFISRTIQHNPKSQIYTVRCAETRPRSDAGQRFRRRAMMMSSSAGQDSNVVFVLKHVDVELIRRHLIFDEFQDSVWGFVIYRCCNASDEDWERMLQKIRSQLDNATEFQINQEYRIGQDLVPLHDLHPIDDPSLYGASIDQARHHFRSWIPKNIKSRLRPEAADLHDTTYRYLVEMTPRYKYCLYVDDECIESLNEDDGDCLVVKMLEKTWEPYTREEIEELERNGIGYLNLDGTTLPRFPHGLTNNTEENLGWMYMPVGYYVDKYFTFLKWDWPDVYVRPPFIDAPGEARTRDVLFKDLGNK